MTYRCQLAPKHGHEALPEGRAGKFPDLIVLEVEDLEADLIVEEAGAQAFQPVMGQVKGYHLNTQSLD